MNTRGATWRKSSRSSGGGNNDCVEVAQLADAVAVRDSRNRDGHVLTYAPTGWTAFVAGIRAGDFDRP